MPGQIERIQVFLEVADRQSFAAAARALNTSRSAVTRIVGELEQDLGVQLLVRTTRSVALTAAGVAYAERTRPLLVELKRANAFVHELQGSLKGTMRLSAPLSLGLRFLPEVLAQFRTLNPEVELMLDLTDRFVDILSEPYDMALRISGPPTDKSTIWRKICVVPRILVASPIYLERSGIPRMPQDLAGHDCLGYTYFAGGNILDLISRATGENLSVTAHHRFVCNNGDMIAEMAVRHEGVALLPRFIVNRWLRTGQLVAILEEWEAPKIWLTAFLPPYAVLPAKVARLITFIEAAVGENAQVFEAAGSDP